ncbi:MAG: ABC transporter permease [Actinobacteria bacterium]|nr:MAG: ABC transporter permease [Actinomycetota bacterium]
MSEPESTGVDRDGAPTLGEDPEAYAPSVAGRLAFYQRAGGIVTPLTTTIVAFLMGGIVVLSTHHNPLRTYKAIFEGAGLNWFFHVGSHHITVPFTQTHVWFWWDTNTSHTAAYNLTQTLLTTTPLILTGLAVAFAFRCGLFNIGGQGQYLVGAIVGVYIGSRFTTMPHLPHLLFGLVAAALGGALWAAIAGALKASVGAHEVITTIMLNWIAYWGGSYLVGRGGPLRNHVDQSIPVSDDVVNGAKLPAIWGNPHLQALHAGIFIALGALIAFYVILNRTTLGYEVRAVGFNPEAARYGGISVARNFVLAMTISGLFAGLAGALDIFGWQFRLGVADVQVSNIGFIGIAVALLGRTSAVGVGLAALLFGALFTGTSTRSLDPTVFPPELAGNLALMIQALILLFVGADLVILYIWQARRKLRLTGRAPATKGSA